METHNHFMHRCLQLAMLGKGMVAPNPLVGCIVVVEGTIISEGYHICYGKEHAEVNAIRRVSDKSLLAKATVYVNLEPCGHYGKTPPCAQLLIESGVQKVVVGCTDPNPLVAGTGIKLLKEAGIDVTLGVMEDECREINKRFFTFHLYHRPYIILKWAQTINGIFGYPPESRNRMTISNEYVLRMVHKWRAEEQSIMVGVNTVFQDDPELTTRYYPGKNPIRLLVDPHLKTKNHPDFKIYNSASKTVVFSYLSEQDKPNLEFVRLSEGHNLIHQLIPAVSKLNISSVLVEGGAKLLQSFIEAGYWDEARVITASHSESKGIRAPMLSDYILKEHTQMADNLLQIFHHA